MTFADLDGNGLIDPGTELLQEDNYYPFGMRHGSPEALTASPPNKYLYNGKELEDELGLGWYDYGFRWSMPDLGRFVSVDPLAEDFKYLTTYQYAGNTPIWAVDLDGLEPALPSSPIAVLAEGLRRYERSALELVDRVSYQAKGALDFTLNKLDAVVPGIGGFRNTTSVGVEGTARMSTNFSDLFVPGQNAGAVDVFKMDFGADVYLKNTTDGEVHAGPVIFKESLTAKQSLIHDEKSSVTTESSVSVKTPVGNAAVFYRESGNKEEVRGKLTFSTSQMDFLSPGLNLAGRLNFSVSLEAKVDISEDEND